ncbi:hypothetical protein AMIS_30540 [Actinoplanes missouriensis 431]|uniref:Uncharacterized protein n=1 Tax=Actinoplanes missouriensis (strain ATCC 14538 / DSM 43046 / CBS 188.64 / JCM 3121 / NBRC 102363 / NCIMB 12654 / NRRL B-3342 / UNCC 431) TaxID=512565 RepID=I0H5I7_ACTM4|nr:DUF4173 domain-containing protein [Actinoplanes missouriensis]BAL88274.1 hypothetical protein AMIS_30540 [Actinoplanes missouriensis 431]
MADLPPEKPDPAETDVPVPAPQLLVMPPSDAIPSMVWPGTDGEVAWAIPVQIPSGTRGYALFVPMVPAQPATVDAAEPAAVASSPKPAAAAASSPKPAAAAAASSPEPAAAAVDSSPKSAPAPAAVAESPKPVSKPAAVANATPSDLAGATVQAFPPMQPQRSTPPGQRPQSIHPFGTYERPPSAWETFRKKNWPGPKQARGWAVPGGVLAGALGFLVFLPLDRVGIGWFLGWLALTLGVGFAVRGSKDLSRTERLIRSGWAAAALALMLIPAFRNAWWLVTFSVIGAIGCTALAIVGGRQVRSILFSLVAAPYAAFAGIPWVRRHLKSSREPGIARRIFFSVALTVVVLFVFGALLSSADVAFSNLLDDAVPDLAVGSIFTWVFLTVAGGLLAVSGIYTLTAPPATSSLDTEGKGRFGLIEWAPAGAALVLLFAGFVGVQFTVLFGGSRHVLKTAGLSYSEYARSGFWQLVAVTLLSLALIAALARWAKRDQPGERVMLRVLLGLLCGLSVVIVASALSRMWEYQRVYSFTGERIFVMASEMLLGVIFVLIAVAGIKWQGRWIPATTVGLAVMMLLGLAVLDPEGYVASRNAARYEGSGKIDAWYLRALSADATPALAELPDPVRRCTLSWIAKDLKEPDPWYAWNLGRQQAREELKKLGPGAIGNQKDCTAADQFDLPKTRR